MFFISFFSRFIDCFAPCGFFLPRKVSAPIYAYFHVHVHQRNGCNRRFSGCLQQNVGESGYAISSWSASAGYSASMLTRVAKVDSSSTRQLLAPSVNISAGYPALPDHDSMNNPSILGDHLSLYQI